jgi:hypothetical protein
VGDLPKNERRAVELAGLALSCGMRGDWDKATRATQRISDECGPAGLERAMLAWIDTFAAQMGHKPGQRVRIVFQEIETGTIRTAGDEQIRPEIQWAAKLIAARTADDIDEWTALMDERAGDPVADGKGVGALMETIAQNMANLARRRP